MQKKNILVVINYMRSTSETFIWDELEYLQRIEDVKVSVLHFGSTEDDAYDYGVDLPHNALDRWKALLRKPSIDLFRSLRYRNGLNGTLGFLMRYFQKNKFDVIYCHFGTNGKKIAQLKSLGIIPSETRLVVRFHGFEMDFTKFPEGFYDILKKHADMIFYGSLHAKKDLEKYGVLEENAHMLPVGVSEKNIQSVPQIIDKIDKAYRIISVGRLVPFKGYKVALKVMKLLKERSAEKFSYTIIGSGEQLDELLQIIVDDGLEDVVEVIDGMNHEDVISRLQNSDIYLYTGIYDANNRAETQGLANLEAMGTGLPIIAAAVGGVVDYIIDGVNGFLVPAENVEGFVEKLIHVMEEYDSEEILRLRENAVKMVQENYCQEALNEKLVHLLLGE
ncbi:MAG: glycosyltransferase family 4 protein [Weeksellaceae bacterium]|nr:glycosyltransferase family 4 protein [Weeksellaceae bacterium]